MTSKIAHEPTRSLRKLSIRNESSDFRPYNFAVGQGLYCRNFEELKVELRVVRPKSRSYHGSCMWSIRAVVLSLRGAKDILFNIACRKRA